MKMANSVVLGGRLTRDAEIRYSQKGKPITKFQIAHNRSKFNRETNSWEQYKPSFISCVAFDNVAEEISKFTKGTPVEVSGFLVSSSFDKRDGSRGYTVEIFCKSITVLDLSKKKPEVAETEVETEMEPDGGTPEKPNDGPVVDDEIPF